MDIEARKKRIIELLEKRGYAARWGGSFAHITRHAERRPGTYIRVNDDLLKVNNHRFEDLSNYAIVKLILNRYHRHRAMP